MRSAIIICMLALAGCGGHEIPDAPAYSLALLSSTTVEWQIDGDKISGHYQIDHAGDTTHTYIVALWIVSANGKQFVVANGTPASIGNVNEGGWSDLGQANRDKIDWPSARIWCEVCIYNEEGDVIFHGIEESAIFPAFDSSSGTQASP